MKLARALGAIGRTMITLGVLILLFVVYQLWGTGIREAQAQDRLKDQFNEKLAQAPGGGDGDTAVVGSTDPSTPADSAPPSSTPATVTNVAPDVQAPREGDVLGKIEIPEIGLNAYVVEGVGVDDLKNGPGHYSGTPLPGEKGNASIAGHRTTYGAPFANVDQLQVGDPITVTTLQGVFQYTVACADGPNAGQTAKGTDCPAHLVVSPSDVKVLDDVGDNRLTLTACHPKWSASQRIVVSAMLQGTPVATVPQPVAAPTAVATPANDADLSGQSAPKLPVLLYGLLCAAIWLAAWVLAKRWRKWPAYALGLPFFLIALFYFFENFSRLLPSNY